jgi:hypothetical protein
MPAIARVESEMVMQSFLCLLPELFADDGRHRAANQLPLRIAAAFAVLMLPLIRSVDEQIAHSSRVPQSGGGRLAQPPIATIRAGHSRAIQLFGDTPAGLPLHPRPAEEPAARAVR